MYIVVNGSMFRELRDSLLPDIVQMLGEASFPFKLDQAQNTLRITHPIMGNQIIIVCENPALQQALVLKAGDMLEECGFYVTILERIEDQAAVIQAMDKEKPILWLKLQQGSSQEWSAQFSFQQMKWSKSLAHRIINQLSRCSDLEIQGVQFNWKNMIGSIVAKSDPPFPAVTLNCGSVEGLSSFQQGLLAQGLVKAITSVYTDRPILEVLRALRSLAYEPGVHPQVQQEGVTVSKPSTEHKPDHREQQHHSTAQDQAGAYAAKADHQAAPTNSSAAHTVSEARGAAGTDQLMVESHQEASPEGSEAAVAEQPTDTRRTKVKKLARLHRSYDQVRSHHEEYEKVSCAKGEGLDNKPVAVQAEAKLIESALREEEAPKAVLEQDLASSTLNETNESNNDVRRHNQVLQTEQAALDQTDSPEADSTKDEEQKMKKPPSYSTFLLLKVTHQGKEAPDRTLGNASGNDRQRGQSFMTYMNQLSTAKEPERKQQEIPTFNILTNKQSNKS